MPTGDPKLSVVNSPALDQAQDYLEGAASMLRGGEVETEVVVSQGHPDETIVAEAESHRADLIVMATHARGRPSGG